MEYSKFKLYRQIYRKMETALGKVLFRSGCATDIETIKLLYTVLRCPRLFHNYMKHEV